MSQRRRTIGLDVGERRIGVAIADELGAIASPLTVVWRGRDDLVEIRKIVRNAEAGRLVIGMPTGLSGREGPQAAAVRAYAAELSEALSDVQIEFWDERLTTAVAERTLREHGGRRNRRTGEVDAIAAAVILQGFLDANRARSVPGSPSRRNEAG